MTDGPPTFNSTISGTGFQGAGYKNATAPNQGLTGISSAITDFTLDRNASFGPAPTDWSDLWLQPNVGTGVDTTAFPSASPGEFIEHNHPAFHITGVVANQVTVVSDTSDPDYHGSMQQASLDVYTLPPPPIANPGDPFVVGDLNGHPGDPSGFDDACGEGSLGLSVAQGVITQVRSGGGGGGGSRSAGASGEDSPNVGPNEGTLGGPGGAGYLTGTVASVANAVTLNVTGTPFAGLDLDGGADPITEPPYVLFPDVTTHYYFVVASHTDSQVVIEPVMLTGFTAADTNSNLLVDLSDVASLGPGSTFRLEPAFSVGAAGGGGSGVHLANTQKFPPAPNLTLPKWTAGAGGGAGGGSLVIESARRILINQDGSVRVQGGDGGRTMSTAASGGGGGGGGTVVLRSGDTGPFAVEVQGLLDASGGSGGAGVVAGGDGGAGRVRFEGRGPLSGVFGAPTVDPPATATDIGFFLPVAGEQSVGTSLFYDTGALTVQYDGFEVVYDATVDGVPMTGIIYDETSLDAGDPLPFELTFDDAAVGPGGGIDPSSIDGDYVADPRPLIGALIRFRIVLTNGPVTVMGVVYEDVEIDQVTIRISG